MGCYTIMGFKVGLNYQIKVSFYTDAAPPGLDCYITPISTQMPPLRG